MDPTGTKICTKLVCFDFFQTGSENVFLGTKPYSSTDCKKFIKMNILSIDKESEG